MLMVKVRAPRMKTAAIPINSEALSSCSNESRLVHIRKTICSKFLPENQRAKILPSSSLVTTFRCILHARSTLILFSWA